MPNSEKLQQLGRAVLETEARAVAALTTRIDQKFAQACQFLLACQGRIIVMGMGKSGHIGNKIASTLASTGSPAFFIHPAEASHGDLGMITKQDVVLILSNSGETTEFLTILPRLKRLGIPLISLTGKIDSTMANAADINLDVSVLQEACPLGLAPTASTTAALAMGDALAIALLEAKGFTAQDFAHSHPGGILGKRLLLYVKDIMRTGVAIPTVSVDTSLLEALLEMSKKALGMTTIQGAQNEMLGIFTDGDLRRVIDRKIDIPRAKMKDVMTINGKTIPPGMLAAEALQLMERYKITVLPVVDPDNKALGILHMHDLLIAGVV
ncbi:MAG: KpsF/GutQ family sugar-phosphate isomerase [Gammaproteobacteria bacterium]